MVLLQRYVLILPRIRLTFWISPRRLYRDFNMMMVADTSASDKEIATLSKELAALGDEIGVVIHCQHEDIFNVMHRI